MNSIVQSIPRQRFPFRLPDLNRMAGILGVAGFGWVVPLLRLATGQDPRRNAAELWRQLGVPLAAIVCFLAVWGALAPKVETSLGAIPGPAQVWTQAGVLYADHKAERAKEADFYARQDKRNAEKLAANPQADVKWRSYTGKPTYLDQILTSLRTVFMGSGSNCGRIAFHRVGWALVSPNCHMWWFFGMPANIW